MSTARWRAFWQKFDEVEDDEKAFAVTPAGGEDDLQEQDHVRQGGSPREGG